jgi:hypothetical protein
MEKEQAEIFFQNVKWFNNFFVDLKTLFDKISNIVEKEMEYSEKSFYYYKSNDRPSIPSTFFCYLGGEGKRGIQLVAVLNNDDVTNKTFAIKEPTLFVVLHNCDNVTNGWVSLSILQGKDIKQIAEVNNVISGIIGMKPDVNFWLFKLPLDLFSEYEDKIVTDHIISPIRLLPQ